MHREDDVTANPTAASLPQVVVALLVESVTSAVVSVLHHPRRFAAQLSLPLAVLHKVTELVSGSVVEVRQVVVIPCVCIGINGESQVLFTL